MTYPEHDKMRALKDEAQAIGDFVEWAASVGIRLARIDDYGRASTVDLTQVLADWADIDLEKLDAEKREMLKQLRDSHCMGR